MKNQTIRLIIHLPALRTSSIAIVNAFISNIVSSASKKEEKEEKEKKNVQMNDHNNKSG